MIYNLFDNMEIEIRKIKCPCCGAVLTIKKIPGIEGKNIKCPICSSSSPYKNYKDINVAQIPNSECTQCPSGSSSDMQRKEETQLNLSQNFTYGELTVLNSNVPKLRLKTGKIIIGRKANSSVADFQIPTDGSNRMSKEHLVIEVKKVPQRGIVHYISLYKERVNDTFLNNEKMVYGDCVVLKNGDLIKLPDATLKFEISDDEGTEL